MGDTWTTEFPWLLVVEKPAASSSTATTEEKTINLLCTICRSVYGPLANCKCVARDKLDKYANGQFVIGSTNLKHSALVSHDLSDSHKDAVLLKKAKDEQPGEMPSDDALASLNKQNMDRLGKLFRNAHAIVKNCRSMTDFTWMARLDKSKKVDIGDTYLNDKSCMEMVVAIAESTRHPIEKLIENCKFLSIMSDGSSDISNIENEIVYVHFAIEGRVYCYFMGLVACPIANADGIFSAIKKGVQCSAIPPSSLMRKVVGFAGDGASVNTGEINRVISHFRTQVSEEILMLQCMGHRTELMFKDGAKTSKLYDALYEILNELFKLYRSPKQKSGLKECFKALNKEERMPTRVGGTRWLSHTKTALTVLLRSYKVYMLHLSQVKCVSLLVQFLAISRK